MRTLLILLCLLIGCEPTFVNPSQECDITIRPTIFSKKMAPMRATLSIDHGKFQYVPAIIAKAMTIGVSQSRTPTEAKIKNNTIEIEVNLLPNDQIGDWVLDIEWPNIGNLCKVPYVIKE